MKGDNTREVADMKTNFGAFYRDKEAGVTGTPQDSWGFSNERWAGEIDKRFPDQWVEFVLAGQRRKWPMIDE